MQSVCITAMGLAVWFIGCSSKVEEHQQDTSEAGKPNSAISDQLRLKHSEANLEPALDFSGLIGVLSGKWQLKDDTLEFTTGSTVFLNRSGFEKVARFQFESGVLKIDAESDGIRRASATLKPNTNGKAPNQYVYAVEFLSDGEVSLRLEQSGDGFDWFQLAGRWKRISLPADREQLQKSFGPVAEAKRQVQRIEQKLAKLELVLQTTLSDRDDLAAKLRSVGVNSSVDLKNNQRGMRLAESAVKLAGEIDSLERQLSDIDAELLKAKSIVRRMEREKAGLSEHEMANLAIQLREAEERMDGTPLPVTPLDVDAAVERALNGSGKK
jgi:hypothetical protein